MSRGGAPRSMATAAVLCRMRPARTGQRSTTLFHSRPQRRRRLSSTPARSTMFETPLRRGPGGCCGQGSGTSAIRVSRTPRPSPRSWGRCLTPTKPAPLLRRATRARPPDRRGTRRSHVRKSCICFASTTSSSTGPRSCVARLRRPGPLLPTSIASRTWSGKPAPSRIKSFASIFRWSSSSRGDGTRPIVISSSWSPTGTSRCSGPQSDSTSPGASGSRRMHTGQFSATCAANPARKAAAHAVCDRTRERLPHPHRPARGGDGSGLRS